MQTLSPTDADTGTDRLTATREALRALEARHPWHGAEIDGLRWRWMDTGGAGPGVALLPGAVGDGAMFMPTIEALRGRLRLIAVSYPDDDDPARLAAGFARLMRGQGWQGLAVAGSSYGAYWAQFLAKAHGDLLGALLLGNTFTEAGDVFEDPVAEAAKLRGADGPSVHAQWLARIRSAPASALRDLQEVMLGERQDVHSLRRRMLGVAQARAAGGAALGGRRVVTLACDDDPLIPARGRAAVERAWPDARHERWPRGGHYPHLLEPDRYQALLLDLAGA